jgi:hypothetical protein
MLPGRSGQPSLTLRHADGQFKRGSVPSPPRPSNVPVVFSGMSESSGSLATHDRNQR